MAHAILEGAVSAWCDGITASGKLMRVVAA